MAAGAGDGESPATLSGGSTVVVGREGIFNHRCAQIHADKIRSSDASMVPDLICVNLCASVVETACFSVRTESAISARVGRYVSGYGSPPGSGGLSRDSAAGQHIHYHLISDARILRRKAQRIPPP